jgi:hypothetical protein
MVNVIEKHGKETSAQSSSVTIPYPPEYKDIQTNRRLLQRLATMTGGKIDPNAGDLFTRNAKKARIPADLWWTLTLIGILLFPLDVAFRRLAMDMSEVRELALRGIRELRALMPAATRATDKTTVESVGRLLQSKKSRKPTEERPDWARPQPTMRPVDRKAPDEQQKPEEVKQEADAGSDVTSRLLDAKRRARGKWEK